KRKSIEDKEFEKLKTMEYSDKQKRFKDAINNIDSTDYKKVGDQLGDVSTRTLLQIAETMDTINNILQNRSAQNEHEKEEKRENKTNKESAEPPNSQRQNTDTMSTPDKPDMNDKTSEIIQYIQGSELKKDSLDKYLQIYQSNSKLAKSIGLCLEFWKLDRNNDKSYSSFRKKLEKDNYLQNSSLKGFVDDMCTQKHPEYVKDLPSQDQKKPLSEIIKKLNNITQ
ncbi:MAG: hypothetical protein LBF04_02495, partial [Prevotellaceae bacterium]|nr:hypothetical protein [Prevotellaceae bacterium]